MDGLEYLDTLAIPGLPSLGHSSAFPIEEGIQSPSRAIPPPVQCVVVAFEVQRFLAGWLQERRRHLILDDCGCESPSRTLYIEIENIKAQSRRKILSNTEEMLHSVNEYSRTV